MKRPAPGRLATLSSRTEKQPGARPKAKASNSSRPVPKAGADAPESYEFKAPENTFFDSQVLDAYGEVARTQPAPGRRAEGHRQGCAGPASRQAGSRQRRSVPSGCRTTKTGRGSRRGSLPATEANVARSDEGFGTPELAALLDQSGLRRSPEVVQGAGQTGKAISEDGFVPRRKRSTADETPPNGCFPTWRKENPKCRPSQ